MITVQTKDVASPLSLAVKSKSSKSESGSFAALLQSLSSKSNTPVIKNGVLALHIDDKKGLPSVKIAAKDTKTPIDSKGIKEPTSKSDLLTLLKGDEQKVHSINPVLANALDTKTLKSVMKDAKNYLAEQIKETDAFKKGEIKELPKTTQGLVALAKKVGIDVSKITVETVQTKIPKEIKNSTTTDLETKSKIDTKNDPKLAQKTDATAIIKNPNDSKLETSKTDLETKSKIDTKNDPKLAQKTELLAKDDKNIPLKNEPSSKTESSIVTKNQNDSKSEISKENIKQHVKSDTPAVTSAQSEQKIQTPKTDTLKDDKALHVKSTEPQNEKVETPKQVQKQDTVLAQALTQDESLKKMPLFSVPDETVSAHSTAEIVGKKQSKPSQELSTTKPQSPLSALLHGDKILPAQTQIAEAKKDVKTEIKTDAKIKANSTVLSQLLHGENQQTTQTTEQTASEVGTHGISATQGNGVHVKQTEADLTVKMNEAKQAVKYLAQDIKQAIEDYKPPFTRIKVKLNPQKFGEVDLTVVQRGKNVHVSISSNSAAINMLSQNAGDLKVQLTQNGMNNASLNFNSSTDTQSQQQQQQNGHQKESAKQAYEAFNQDETSEEILSSLEIVIPRYV